VAHRGPQLRIPGERIPEGGQQGGATIRKVFLLPAPPPRLASLSLSGKFYSMGPPAVFGIDHPPHSMSSIGQRGHSGFCETFFDTPADPPSPATLSGSEDLPRIRIRMVLEGRKCRIMSAVALPKKPVIHSRSTRTFLFSGPSPRRKISLHRSDRRLSAVTIITYIRTCTVMGNPTGWTYLMHTRRKRLGI